MLVNESNYDENMFNTPSDYPTYLWDPVEFVDYPYHERPRATIPSHSATETRTPIILERVLLKKDKIAESLVAANRRLGEVVRLRNTPLTRAFLRAKFPTTCHDDASDKLDCSDDQYELIDADTRDSVDRVTNELDLENAEVILTLGPDRYLRRWHFFFNLVTQRRDPKTLGILVKRIVEWGILDEEGSKLIEQVVFQRASKDVVRVYLQHRLEFHIEKSFGNSALAALFANPHFKIGALKRKKSRLRANAAGYAKFTALHYAMKSKNIEKLKYLLDRGADPNASSVHNVTRPLSLALWRPARNPRANERCCELLLQYGANPFLNGVDLLHCVMYVGLASRGIGPLLYAPAEYLARLVLACTCIYDRLGLAANWPLAFIERQLEDQSDLLEFYRGCRRELGMLEEKEVRRGFTMFEVLSRTGERLFRTVNAENRKVIGGFIDEYREDGTINAYYVSAMREHMRQVRKLVAHGNRAMRVVAASATVLAPYFVVLNKIVGYLTYKDLLMFQ